MAPISKSLVTLSTLLVLSCALVDTVVAARWHSPECVAPLPNLLNHQPIKHDGITPELQKALNGLDGHLKRLVSSTPELNSMSIGVVTPAGLVWNGGYGSLKANDTASTQEPDKDSIYRLASITKVFTVFETLLLKQRGVLGLDEPIDKHIPPLTPPSSEYGWSEHLKARASGGSAQQGAKTEKITFRQLASHMSGFGREYPLIEVGNWPESSNATRPPESNTSLETVLRDVLSNPLVTTPYNFPVYSNVGFGLLGMANVAANFKEGEPQTHKDLLKKDIFEPFGLNSSFYVLPNDAEVRSRLAVSSSSPQFAGVPLGDAADPAGGQYGTLSDLARMMSVFLSPTAPSPEFGFLPTLVREWLRPLHVWADGSQAVGAPWEINYVNFGHASKRVSIFNKAGDLPGYHNLFTMNPEYGYGIVLMVSGDFTDTLGVVMDALHRLQPAFQKALEDRVRASYVGKYKLDGGHGYNAAEVKLVKGQLQLTELQVNGVDVLRRVQQPTSDATRGPSRANQGGAASQAAQLWNTGRLDEFRMTFGRSPMTGCLPRWASVDPALTNHGAAIDLVYWEDGQLVYPSANVRFTKQR